VERGAVERGPAAGGGSGVGRAGGPACWRPLSLYLGTSRLS